MALVRWEPARELHSVQSEINRLFNTLFDAPTGSTGNFPQRWVPAMDLIETDHEYVLKADLPGVSEEDVAIEFENNVLTVSGERKSEHEERKDGYRRIERSSGRFSRSLTLPDGVDPSAVGATFDKGVLEIRIPKPEQRKPQKISIKAGPRQAEPETIEASSATTA
jgi:HSP20 family protein